MSRPRSRENYMACRRFGGVCLGRGGGGVVAALRHVVPKIRLCAVHS